MRGTYSYVPLPAPLIDSMIVFVLKLEKFPPISCLVLESIELTVRKCKNLIRLLYSDKLTRSLQMPIINISLCIVHVFRGKAFPVIKLSLPNLTVGL